MRGRLGAVWARLADGFWFVPGATAVGYVALALAAVAVDRRAGSRGIDFAFGGDADAARDILTTIAGSLITVAGLAFSLTIIVLTLVSSQFSPRAVRSLLADRINQVVAGSFVGVFAYCLLVLRTVRDGGPGDEEFVPALGVTLAIGLALLSLALLLTFIHHAGASIQVSRISGRIVRSTLRSLERLYPDPCGEAVEDDADGLVRAWHAGESPALVRAERVGYVQVVALDDVLETLDASGVRLHVPVRPGDVVSERTVVAELWPATALSDETTRAIRKAIVVGEARDLRQDAAYGIRQLTDVALRALSPGINDPTTAETCIAYIGAALEQLAARDIPSPVRRYPERDAVVVARRRTFEEHVEEAFAEIGRYASDNARVVTDALHALSKVALAAEQAGAFHRVACVRSVARAIAQPALERAPTERDRAAIAEALARVEGGMPAAASSPSSG